MSRRDILKARKICRTDDLSIAEFTLRANRLLKHTDLGLLAPSTVNQVFKGRGAHKYTAARMKYVVEHWQDGYKPR